MVTIEMIDEFRRRTGASYDEAKTLLARHNGDILEAIIEYERVSSKGSYSYQGSGNAGWQGRSEQRGAYSYGQHQEQWKQRSGGGFGKSLMRGLQKLIDMKLVVADKSDRTFKIPFIILLLLIPVWHILIPLAIVLLFFGARYMVQEIADPNYNVESVVNKIKENVHSKNV